MAGTADTTASWKLRILAVVLTIAAVVAVFAFRFSANGKEMQAVMFAGVPVMAGVIGAFLVGLIKRFSGSLYRWRVYLYVLLATAVYLIVRTLL